MKKQTCHLPNVKDRPSHAIIDTCATLCRDFIIAIQSVAIRMVLEDTVMPNTGWTLDDSMNQLPGQSGNWNTLPSVTIITPWPNTTMGGKDVPSSKLSLRVTKELRQSLEAETGATPLNGFACYGIQILATVSWCKIADMRSSLASSSTHRIQWRPSQDWIRELHLGFPMEEPHILNLCYQMIEKPSDYSHHPIMKWWLCCPLTSCKGKTPPTKEAPLELSLCAEPKGLIKAR